MNQQDYHNLMQTELAEHIFGDYAEYDHRTYYLAVPYSQNPQRSIELNYHYMKQLVALGKYPFSPVAHTHNFHEYWKARGVEFEWSTYIKWDLAIMDNFHCNEEALYCGFYNEHFVLLMDSDWEHSEGCKTEWRKAQGRKIHRLQLLPFLEKQIKFAYWHDVTGELVY